MSQNMENIENNDIIIPHTNSQNPQDIHKSFIKQLNKEIIKPLPLETPIYKNKVRFVCISDTHCMADLIASKLPAADVLIHAGDFTLLDDLSFNFHEKIKDFNNFIGTLNDRIKYKVVIAGNHDIVFQNEADLNELNKVYKDIIKINKNKYKENPRELLTNCIYLEDSAVNIYGIKIYGSPWQPKRYGSAFNVERGEKILEKWNKIPNDTDVLITHGPPLGFGDKSKTGIHVGCSELLSTVRQKVKPKFHVFGHIHEGYGIFNDGLTTYINASTCDLKYNPINDPIIFDIDIPIGFYKD